MTRRTEITYCYSFSDECWHAYFWIEWNSFGEFRRIGPPFGTKAQAEDYVASARRGQALAPETGTPNGEQQHG